MKTIIETATVEYRGLNNSDLTGLFWVLSVNGEDINYSISRNSVVIEANRLLEGKTAIHQWQHYINPKNVVLS